MRSSSRTSGALQGYYTGLTVKGGSLDLSQAATLSGSQVIINAGGVDKSRPSSRSRSAGARHTHRKIASMDADRVVEGGQPAEDIRSAVSVSIGSTLEVRREPRCRRRFRLHDEFQTHGTGAGLG